MRGLASVSLEPFGRVYGIVVAIELAIRFLRSRAQVRLRQHARAPAARTFARTPAWLVAVETSESSLNCLKSSVSSFMTPFITRTRALSCSIWAFCLIECNWEREA